MRASTPVDVAVIGGGQAGLAVSYYLRRAGLATGAGYVVLDAEDAIVAELDERP